jgi:hypothetical protein
MKWQVDAEEMVGVNEEGGESKSIGDTTGRYDSLRKGRLLRGCLLPSQGYFFPMRRRLDGMARHFKSSVACQVVPSA